jgi:N-acyl-phosphatidylethanolamine-hydrolysing phospholipase D
MAAWRTACPTFLPMKGTVLSGTSRRKFVLSTLAFLTAVAVDQDILAAGERRPTVPGHHVPGGFRNVSEDYSYPFVQRARGLFRRRRAPRERLVAFVNDGRELRNNGHLATATWVGHSTFVVQIGGLNVVTDPHWGEMASPVRFAGPRRVTPPGIRFEDLPAIDAVVISHDHYDHLDEWTILRLAREHRPRFFAPLGIGAWLRARGIENVIDLDWWQDARFRGLTVTCTPAQHSSGRGLDDQNRRLWSSWIIDGGDRRVFFAGDTGYYGGFKEIGERFGPCDLALIPIGGYSDFRRRHPNHVNPEEAVQLLEDVRGEVMIPMHWGTFDFNQEPPSEPPERLMREAAARGLEEQIVVLSPGETMHW